MRGTAEQRLIEGWDTARLLVLSSVIFLSPLVIHSLWTGSGLVYEQPYGAFHVRFTFILIPLDILQVMLIVLSIPKAISLTRSRQLDWSTIASFALVSVAVITWAFHPSVPGTARILRWIAAAAVVVAASRLDLRTFRFHVGIPLIAAAAIQATVALGQYFGPGAVSSDGIRRLAQGTTQYPYVVGFILLVGLTVAVAIAPEGRTRPLWIAAIALCSAGIATSLMRTAFVALLVAGFAYGYGVLFIRDRRRYIPVLAATVLPFMFVAVVVGDPWLQRLLQTLGLGSGLEEVSTGRLLIIKHSLRIIASDPLIGVGTAREAIEAAARFPGDYGPHVYEGAVPSVHVVPLLVAAEMGLAAGVAYLGYLVALAWRALRTSPEAFAVFASVGVFTLLDTLSYDRPTPIILVGVWMVVLDRLSREDETLRIGDTTT